MPVPDESFLRMVEAHQRALRLHCYRMLGSSHDSDDVMQETLVRAWRAKDTLEQPSMLRPWLYRIATRVCLDELKNRKARPLPYAVVPEAENPAAGAAPPSPEATWLEPCPDAWLAGIAQDPGAAYEVKESVALAFVAALQCLSAQQRAVLLLRDVLGMPAGETANTLGMSVSAANSTLFRARTAVRENPPHLARIGANGQPAFALYIRGKLHAIHVLRIREACVVACDHFMGNECFPVFGL